MKRDTINYTLVGAVVAGALALLLVDVDCFKLLNDACGHLDGDECLRELARLCSEVAVGTDAQGYVARYGGEEFALLLPGGDLRDARRLAGRLQRGVATLALVHPRSAVAPYVTVSIGASAVCPDPSQAPDVLIAAADRALYIAKARGRNRVVARAVRP